MNLAYRNRLTVPAAILIVIFVGLAARWIAQPVWSEHFSVVSGPEDGLEIVKTKEIAGAVDELRQQIVSEHLSTASSLIETQQGDDVRSVRVTVGRHFGIWSILPALITLGFCISFREPLPALVLGITVGAFILGRYDLTDEVFLPGLASTRSAGIVLLYLWLLGGLLGIWSRTGAAIAFADWTCRNFVRGPRTAKLVAWFLGVLFFQGGTVSTVLVGTTVRPITDANRISQEELSYIVDSTASPIASLIAFNAWPGYVQSLIFVPGIAYLATESDRVGFFFKCAPLSFYSIFAVLGTFLLAIDKAPVLGRRFRDAIARARSSEETETVTTTGDTESAPGADPTYQSHPLEFVIPLVALIAIAVGTGFLVGSPQVRWAFAAAMTIAGATAICRGMSLTSLVEGIGEGLTECHGCFSDPCPGCRIGRHHDRAWWWTLSLFGDRRQHPQLGVPCDVVCIDIDHRVCHGNKLGHLCDRLSPDDAARDRGCKYLAGRRGAVVCDDLFRGSTQWKRIRRSMLTDLRHDDPQFPGVRL